MDSEKKRLERSAIQLFIELYNQKYPVDLRLLYLQEKPDAILQFQDGSKLGMEITHLYYDAEEAKMLFGQSDQLVHGPENVMHLLDKLNAMIRQKCCKREGYTSDFPVSLLIRNTSSVFGMDDFIRHLKKIEVPQNGFDGIWLLSRNGRSEWFLMSISEEKKYEKE